MAFVGVRTRGNRRVFTGAQCSRENCHWNRNARGRRGGIPGASVVLLGGRDSTLTNDAGRFSITAPNGDVRLQVRAIGFRMQVLTVPAASSNVSAELVADVFNLEQVVVTGQQTAVDRRNATTSTSVVSSDELTQVPAATIDKALQGKVAGAIISQNSGAPGGGMQIQIRGNNTIIGGSDPLFVVDGIIYSNATIPTGLSSVTGSSSNRGNGDVQDDAVNRIADLNPSDIESIEVLKSAAASSIYGSKAANGVVIITTRRGRAGRARTNATQRFGYFSLLRG
ncbi:MAG: TonB-dependent receptor plug domain-containing protein, partial [Gemmatimonadaceae bacterium]